MKHQSEPCTNILELLEDWFDLCILMGDERCVSEIIEDTQTEYLLHNPNN